MNNNLNAKDHKLTKQFFMSLPTGILLVSNVYEMLGPHEHSPSFCEKVVPPEKREEQWKRIKEVRANHRNCRLYANIEVYKKELEGTTRNHPKPLTFKIIERSIESDNPDL